jgi:hypothetical protein
MSLDVQASNSFMVSVDGGPVGLTDTLSVRVEDLNGEEVVPRTTVGVLEQPVGSGTYVATLTAPPVAGSYLIVWDTGEAEPTYATEPLTVAALLYTGTLYAAPAELREMLDVNPEILPDSEAIGILTKACDLIDERLGVRPVDPATGRKVVLGDYADEAWRLTKLRDATLEVAKAIFEDPGLESRQRARYVSGDVSTNGFYGPAFGERAESLINASGLRVNRARMSNGRRRPRLGRFE